MSARELQRSTTANESNIPILKKSLAGAKKSKGCSKLPELQRYIETIIKASNEFDTEVTSLSDREKLPKGKQFGKHVFRKGLENKIKHEKLKFDVVSNKRKNKRQTSKSYSEAVSRGVEVIHKFLSEFEDPRNWKIRNSESHLKIEKLIEKFYPNPYTIRCQGEFQSSETQIFLEKVTNKDSGDEDTLYDVLISKVDAETQDDLDNTNIDLVTADFQVMLSERDDKSTTADVALSFETLPQSKCKESKQTTISNTSNSVRHSVSVSNASSRVSSIESINQVLREQNQTDFLKKENAKSSKEILPKVNVPIDSDYDLGKLKLLNLSDSDGSASKIFPSEQIKNSIASDDFVTEISSEICNEISKTNDLNDLLQIYEVMNKATESFLYLTSMKKPGENVQLDSSPIQDLESPKDLAIETPLKPISKTPDTQQQETTAEKISSLGEPNLLTEIKSEPDSEELENICDIQKGIVASLNESEQTVRKVSDEIFDANQKINEVLEFMNDCFLKFTKDEKPKEDDKKTPESDSGESEKPKILTTFRESSSNLRDSATKASSQTDIPGVESTQPSILERTTKSQNIRIRVKRKPKTPLSHAQEIGNTTDAPTVNEASTSDSNMQPELNAESAVANNNSVILVAEGQNELGAYTEEPQETNTNEDSRMLKSVLPLTTKIRRSQPETYKTLKDALETEEKLLKLNKPEGKKLISCSPESQILIQNDAIGGYPPMSNFEGVNSSFVLCISPAVVAPTIALPKPLSLSLIDFRSWNLKPLSEPVKEYPVEKLHLQSQTEYKALTFMYSFKMELLCTLSSTWVYYSAIPVGFSAFFSYPKIQREYSLEFSKRQIRVKPLKKFSIVNLNTPGTSGFCIKNTVTFTTSKSNLLNDSDSGTSEKTSDKSMEALIKAIQETENVFLLQQQNNSIPLSNFDSICSCRSNKDGSDTEIEKEYDKKKVQNLLLRTYKLQKKLQQYLGNITQPPNSLAVTEKEKTPSPVESLTTAQTDKSASETTVEVPPEKNNTTDEAVAVSVPMVDRSTTYIPPVEEITTDANLEKEEETPLNLENDEDDRSSTYSFKSSNDFSETNEIQNLQEPSGPRDAIKRIFSQIELLKQSVEAENLKRQEKKFPDKTNVRDDKLVEFDPKNPAKVLKTVFKGRKSSTELTIGLKDVPMTNVSNISVEKTKFSPNHTKISICISKETPSKVNSDGTNSKMLSNKVSSYFFDHMRPSLSMCQTEYSKLEDNVSKSSQSLNEESDEDDFKSVASTFDSHSSTNPKSDKAKAKSQEVVKMSQSKNYTKHKFDFYRKMDMNVEGLRVRQRPISNSLLRFKELEPLKQALTELQIRMRSIRREAILNSNDYYERALKLAKMSAGYCQSCGTRAVIPDDTFGYYKNLLPRRHAQNRRNRHFKTAITPNSSFYSFRSSNAEVSGQFCDLDIKGSSSFSLNRTTHSNRTVLRSSLQDMPIVFEKV